MIVSSELVIDNIQTDGRRNVIERHRDDQNNEYRFSYVADADMDLENRLAARADALNQSFEQVP